MKLGDDDRSNLEDRRGLGGTGMRVGVGGALVLAVLSVIFGRDLLTPMMGNVGDGGAPAAPELARVCRQ